MPLRQLAMTFILIAVAVAPATAQYDPGDVYVGSCGSTVYRYEAGTGTVSLFADAGDGLDCPTGITFTGPEGMLILSGGTDTVHEFDSAGNGTVVLASADGIVLPYGENGVVRDKFGRIYVSNYGARQILRFNSNYTGGIVFADASDGIVRPDGLAFRGNGDLIVANRGSGGNILRIEHDGATRVFDTVGGEDFYSVAIRNNGDIYAASFTGNLYRYVSGLPGNRVLLTTLGSANPSITFNSNSTRLYHTSFGDPILRSVHPETGATTDLAKFPEGIVGIGVVPPERFEMNDIFVGSCGDKVYRVDPLTGDVSVFADASDGLACATGLEFRRGGGLLVQSYQTNNVFEFDSNGNGREVLGSGDGISGAFGENGTVQDGRGRIYVSDYDGKRILRFDRDFNNSTVFADSTDGINRPDGLVFTSSGDLLVANRGGDILQITPDGSSSIFDSVSGENFYSLARRNNGDIYAASISGTIFRYVGGLASGRTVLVTLGTGNPSLAFNNFSSVLYHVSSKEATLRGIEPDTGAYATLATGFDTPVSIKVVPPQFNPGTIYLGTCGDSVLEITPGSWTVKRFSRDLSCGSAVGLLRAERGMLASSYADNKVYHYDSLGNATALLDVGDGLNGPFGENGIVQDFDGNVYIANFNSSEILKFDENFENVSVFADASDGLVSPDGMTFDTSGNMFVANRSSGGQVLRILRNGNTSLFDTISGENCFSISFRHSNGDLYVACTSGNVFRYIGGSAGNRVLLGSYGSGNVSIAFDLPESTLYLASDGHSGSLVAVDPDSGTSTVLVSSLGAGVAGIAVAGIQCASEGSFRTYGAGLAGAGGFVPSIDGAGTPAPGGTMTLEIRDFVGRAGGVLILGFAEGAAPGFGGTVYINFSAPFVFLPVVMGGIPGVPGDGDLSLPVSILEDEIVCGLHSYWQVLCGDPAAALGVSMTNGLDVAFGN